MASKVLKKWLTGSEVMSQWNLKAFELLECLRKGLPVYNQNTLWPVIDDADYEKISLQLAHPIDIPHHRVGDYSELSPDLVNCVFLREKVEEFAVENGLKKDIPDAEEGKAGQKIPSEEYETFVRSLRVTYESTYEISIQEPGKSPKLYTCNSLGFRDEKTKEWKTLCRIISDRPHSFDVGPAYFGPAESRQRVPAYDSNRKLLENINKKLVAFLNATYKLDIPSSFKLYEKDLTGEHGGTYKFIFLAEGESARETSAEPLEFKTREDLRAEIKKLCSSYLKAHNQGYDAQAEELICKISEVGRAAIERGDLTEDELSELLPYNVDEEFKDIRYEPDENERQRSDQ
jgi:hypothetical protein